MIYPCSAIEHDDNCTGVVDTDNDTYSAGKFAGKEVYTRYACSRKNIKDIIYLHPSARKWLVTMLQRTDPTESEKEMYYETLYTLKNV